MKTFHLADTFDTFTTELVYGEGRTKKTVIAYTQSLRVFQRYNTTEEFTADKLATALKKVAMTLAKDEVIKKTSINVMLRSFNSFFTWLHRSGYADTSVKVKLLKEEEKTLAVYTDDDLQKLKKYKPVKLSEKRAWTIAMLILDCGPRIDEVLNLRREDIDVDNCILTIVKGKGQKGRKIPFSNAMRGILFKYMRDITPKEINLVFSTSSGGKVTHRNVSADLQRIGDKLKLSDKLRFHQLRHTFGTYYIKRGGDISMLQKVMGHASITTTQIYLHHSIETLREKHGELSPFANDVKVRRGRPITKPKSILNGDTFDQLAVPAEGDTDE